MQGAMRRNPQPAPSGSPGSPAASSMLPAFIPASPLVSAEDLGIALSAHALLARAEAEAQAIVAAAEADAARIREAAEREAGALAERGHAAGWERAQREFAERMAQRQAQQARSLLSQEERMCMLVTRTLGKVLAEQHNDERFFAGVMTRVLRAARDEKYLTVRVADEQRDAADKAIRQVIEKTAAPNFIEVLGDPALKRGACIVESAHGVIDASLETQLDAIRDALLAVWKKPAHG